MKAIYFYFLCFYFLCFHSTFVTCADESFVRTSTVSFREAEAYLKYLQNAINSTKVPPLPSCEPEIFYHDFLLRGDRLQPVTNLWQSAKIGQHAGLQKVCLLPNGLPLTRQCWYNSQLGRPMWEPMDNSTRIKCLKDTRETIITSELSLIQEELLRNESYIQSKENRCRLTKRVRDTFERDDYKILPADVHIASHILTKLTEESQDAEASQDIVGICNSIMSSDEQVLQLSAKLNTTNSLLETFENYMDSLPESFVSSSLCKSGLSTSVISKPTAADIHNVSGSGSHAVETVKYPHFGVHAHLTGNLSVFFVNPHCANITGIGIYDPKNVDPQSSAKLFHSVSGKFSYRFIYMNETTAEIMKESGIQVASFIPQSLWEFITDISFFKDFHVVFKIYSTDSLFIETSNVQTCKPSSKVLSISIPHYRGHFPDVLPLILRNQLFGRVKNTSAISGSGCGYWNYDSWVRKGVETTAGNVLDQPVILCGTRHLTQFSFLVGGSYRQNDYSNDILITPIHQKALDIISLCGCTLSLLGLLGIWLTAALFKNWRSLSSTKVLLNMCVALTLQMILFVFVNTDDMSENLIKARSFSKCVALGALLQYSILVLFTWMLIIAFLQFQRYVTVIGIERPPHYILKSAIAAWGLPLIPTLLVALIDPRSYIPTSYQLQTDSGVCYPSGYGLYLGVILPVTLICLANLTIFIAVFYSISHTLNQAMQRQEKKMLMKQIRLSILLFFLLGISWFFGLFAFMQISIVFSYLFCLTATLQGFVLFLYFVILDAVPRREWSKLLCSSRSEKIQEKQREMQSITTSSGLEGQSIRSKSQS